jgi:hypothetical protein
MRRKILMALAASAAIAITQLPTAASAAMRGGMGMSHTGPMVSHSAAIRSPSLSGATFNHTAWSGAWGHRPFFHRHRFFRNRFFVGAPFALSAYAAYDSCYRWRHVWTPWGWRLRRIYVCDYPYVY